MRYHLNAPARHTIRRSLLEYQKQLKAAKRENKKAFIATTEADAMLDATSQGLEIIPAVLSDDHDGNFELDVAVVFVVRCGLMLQGADLIRRREGLSERNIKTGDVQDKIDELVRLQAALGEQRDLYEFVGQSEASVDDVMDVLVQTVHVDRPTREEVEEWPFTWRLEVYKWGVAVIANRDAREGDTVPEVPPRPSVLNRSESASLWDQASIEETPELVED
jgi:hypothetical protein